MNAEIIACRMAKNRIDVNSAQAAQLANYLRLLLEWNSRMDLTAVTDAHEALDYHLVDSLSALACPGLWPTGLHRVIDVGTGAGLPGLPLAICLPEVDFVLLDAQQKRLTFLQAVLDELGLKNVTLVHARAEDGVRERELRERFDLAVARAVAPVPVLAEYLLPYVRLGGTALCWKGPSVAGELQTGAAAARVLGGALQPPVPVTLAGRDWQHVLLPITKMAPTPRAYPRKAGTPAKAPLGAS